jgi:hypothetical protein
MPVAKRTLAQLSELLARVLENSAPPGKEVLDGKVEVVMGRGVRVAMQVQGQEPQDVPVQVGEHSSYVVFGEGLQALHRLSEGLGRAIGAVHPQSVLDALKPAIGQLRDQGVPAGDRGALVAALTSLETELGATVGEWTAVMPVQGLALSADLPTITVGDVTFQSWHALEWPGVVEARELLADQKGPLFPGTIPGTTVEVIAAAWQYLHLVGRVNVLGDQRTATDRARTDIGTAVDLLQCLTIAVNRGERRAVLEVPGGLPWYVESCLLLNRVDERMGGGLTIYRRETLDLDAGALEWLKANLGFDRLQGMLSGVPTETQDRLRAAVRWLARGARSTDPNQRLLSACIALESLVCPSADRRIAEWLGQALCFLVGHDVKSRNDICGFVRKVYQARSHVAHAGEQGSGGLNDQELLRLDLLALKAISVVAESHDAFPTNRAFCDWVNERLLSLPGDL